MLEVHSPTARRQASWRNRVFSYTKSRSGVNCKQYTCPEHSTLVPLTQHPHQRRKPSRSSYGCPPSWMPRTGTLFAKVVLLTTRSSSGSHSLKTPSMTFVERDASVTDLSPSIKSSLRVKGARRKRSPGRSCRLFKIVSTSTPNATVWLVTRSSAWTCEKSGKTFTFLSPKPTTEVQERSWRKSCFAMASMLSHGSGARAQHLSPLTRSTRTCAWSGLSLWLVRTVGRKR
jgi:hypothetical protein